MVYTLKGTELQETTVCHAEENSNIKDKTEEIFEKNKFLYDPNYAFSLSPFKSFHFAIYDDQKVSLQGIIQSPEFE